MSKYQNLINALSERSIPWRTITDQAILNNIPLMDVTGDILRVLPDADTVDIALAFDESALDEDLQEINWTEKGVFTLSDVNDKIIDLKRNPTSDEGKRLPWINVKMTLKPEIYVITGIPGMGKSAWVDNVIMNSIRMHGYKWSIFSPEQLPVEEHARTLIEIASNSNFYGKYNTRETNEEVIGEAVTGLNEYLYFLNPPDDNSLRIENILGLIEEQVYEFGINAFILDPYNEFSHTRPQTISETEYVSHFFQKVRRFCKKHNCMAWIVAHPTKLRKNEDGTYPVPTAYDIAGSANFYNKADQIIVVHREKNRDKNPDNIVQVVVQKVKKKGTGELGMYDLKYNYGDGTYTDFQKYEDVEVPEYYNK